MMAETQEEVMGCKDYMQVMKGKRTKRQRPQSPLTLAMVSNCSSAAESGGEGERFSDNSVVIGGLERSMAAGASGSSTTSVQEFTTSTEEEEDMANCLILLAQGRHTKKLSAHHQPAVKSNPNIATTNKPMAAAGLYIYECKTCNRCFPSFQALGGHRASHKKPKVNNNNNKEEDDHHFGNMMNTTLSLQIANRVANLSANSSSNNNNGKANKVHECSICGAEFSSGQALGGHMRRHRAFMSTTTTTTPTALSHCIDQAEKHPRSILQLDLNLPAPEDHVDRRESKFSFASKEQVIVFSASSLVDCHY